MKDWAKDRVITHAEIHLGFFDRLKVLFGRVVRVTIEVDTENEPGRVEGRTSAHVDRFFQRYRRDRGAEVVQSPPDETAYA